MVRIRQTPKLAHISPYQDKTTSMVLCRKGNIYREHWLKSNLSVHKQKPIFDKTKETRVNLSYKAKRISLSLELKSIWIFNKKSSREITTEEVGKTYKTNVRKVCERITGPTRYNEQLTSVATLLKQGTLIEASDASVKIGIKQAHGFLPHKN